MNENKNKLDDCWNRIGVWAKGDRSCAKLKEAVHCANCEVFSSAGRQLLECDPPAGYLEEWAKLYASEQKSGQKDTSSVILFRLGDEWLGLDTIMLDEIISIRSVHGIPHRKSPVLRGLTNVRGELQLCVSMGRLLNINRGEIAGTNVIKGIYERMMVISNKSIKFVFPVSEIRGVYRYAASDVTDAPATAINCAVHFLRGMLEWEGRHVGIIDPESMFSALERGIV